MDYCSTAKLKWVWFRHWLNVVYVGDEFDDDSLEIVDSGQLAHQGSSYMPHNSAQTGHMIAAIVQRPTLYATVHIGNKMVSAIFPSPCLPASQSASMIKLAI